MTVKKMKSKKQSAANSKPPRKDFLLFLDRNLGKHVIADALRAVGSIVEIHDDHLPIDAPDEDWISLVGQCNWLAITKDKNIRWRAAEILAIKQYSARVFVVRAKNCTGLEIAEILISARTKLQNFAHKNEPPFVAGINRSGGITKYVI